jgi:hypothetical protein
MPSRGQDGDRWAGSATGGSAVAALAEKVGPVPTHVALLRSVSLAARHAGHRAQGTPAPGAQLRLTDIDGLRVTAFATNTTRGQLADLELRHRRHARCEDRIRWRRTPA